MNRNTPIRLVVIGAGLVGQRHARHAFEHPDIDLAWIVDPNPDQQALARELDCRWAPDLESVPASDCDAAVIATPNSDHLPSGLACLERKWATLVEKPVADTVENGEKLVNAFEARRLPLLVGHHRRYHPSVEKAQELIGTAALGAPVSASLIWAVRKPDSYFQAGLWRRKSDGGPLLINFIHEADLLVGLFGPVKEVQAMVSHHARGSSVEDSAAINIRFASGVIATAVLTDAALTPWSFEGASGENPNIAETGISSWRIGCTAGSFEFPALRVWTDAQGEEGDWSRPLKHEMIETQKVNPLHEQLTHFASLIRQESSIPKVSGRDGLEALRLVEAVRTAALTGRPVVMDGPVQNASIV
ncbi:Gfo/Idh/MocA family protein [Roseibium sp.]|uniref:Gfo/Idh/MocA family protein n=1 Tax=Roseibium sp. TaxID=1936156 RepID=UPI003B5066F8